jgi:hypothetical protein
MGHRVAWFRLYKIHTTNSKNLLSFFQIAHILKRFIYFIGTF